MRTLLLAPDPVLPRRDELLDGDVMVDHLSTLFAPGLPGPIETCELILVKYRWAESLRVVYRLGIGAQSALVAARVFASAELALQAAVKASGSTRGDQRAPHRLAPVTLDAAHNAVWWAYPHDRRLDHLDLFEAPPAHLASLPLGRWETSAMAQYAPERSATARALDSSGQTVAFAKLYRHPVDAAHIADLMTQIDSGLRSRRSIVSSPRPLGHDADLGLLLLEPMGGVGWNLLPADGVESVVATIGAGLGEVHSLEPVRTRRFERLDLPKLRRAAELVATARPDVANSASRLADRLAGSVPLPGRQVQLHGDIHPKNVLIDGRDVAFIDFDQSGLGAPAADVGSLIARLHSGALVGEHDERLTARMIEAVLDGYRGVAPSIAERELTWHVAAALLAERALRAVTRIHPLGLASLRDVLALAHQQLDAIGVR